MLRVGLSRHLSESHQRRASSWQIRALSACLLLSAAACAAATEDTSLSGSESELQPALGLAAEPLINGMKYKPRTFAFVLVDIGDGINLSKEEAQKRLFGVMPGDRSIKQYYNEASYGTQDISGEVLGPFDYPMTTRCDNTGLARTLKPMVGMYDHYLWYFGSRTTACQFSGLAEGGQPERPTNDTWYNGSANCVVLIQEPGHNFGMMHSSSLTCGTMPFADNPANDCEHNEYGDRYDPMGGSCNHMNGWQKVFEGWLQQCNGLHLKSSGMYTLQPLELACDGPQVLQIPMPKTRPFGRSGGGGFATEENIAFYYLELRTPRGFDSTMRNAPTVLVRVAEEFRDRKDRGRHTWILDMDPATRQIDGLGAGQSYTDPAGGVSFQVVSVSMDSATIQVTIPNGTGPATCLDDTTYDPAVPRPCAGLVGPDGKAGDPVITMTDTGPMPVPPPSVTGFILVDADTNKDLRPVADAAVLDLGQLPPSLTLRVETDPPAVGSVVFRIDAGAPRPENIAPYSISSHDGRGDFPAWMLMLGAHTVTATAYEGPNGTGRAGEPFEIDFMLTRSGAAVPAASADAGALASGDVQASSGAAGALASVGRGVRVSAVQPVAGSPAFPVVPAQGAIQEASGCACHAAGVRSAPAQRAWSLAALALALTIWRRRRRAS
jgi:hypothetical protein